MNYIWILFCASWNCSNHCSNAFWNLGIQSFLDTCDLWKMLSIQSCTVISSHVYFCFRSNVVIQFKSNSSSQRWFVWLEAKQTTKLKFVMDMLNRYLVLMSRLVCPCLGKRTPPTDRWRADFWKYKWSRPPANYLWKRLNLSWSFHDNKT